MKVFSLGSPFGKEPCDALAKGLGCEHEKMSNAEWKESPVVVWGQLRGAKELLHKKTHFYRMDHAYMKRMDYFRITRNDFQPSKVVERPSDRWESLKKRYGVKMVDWRRGKNIVVALSDPRTYEFFNVRDFKEVTEGVLKQHTDRPIIFRSREEKRPLGEDLKDAWALVTYASNSVIESLLAGVPVFPLGPSISRPMGHSDLSLIETPLFPDNRDEFFRHMAYCQFTTDEFKSGFAIKTADETWASGTH